MLFLIPQIFHLHSLSLIHSLILFACTECPRISQSNLDISEWISQYLVFHRKFIDKEIFITRIHKSDVSANVEQRKKSCLTHPNFPFFLSTFQSLQWHFISTIKKLNLSHGAVVSERTFFGQTETQEYWLSFLHCLIQRRKLYGKNVCDMKFSFEIMNQNEKVIFMLCCHFARGQKQKTVQTFSTVLWMVSLKKKSR